MIHPYTAVWKKALSVAVGGCLLAGTLLSVMAQADIQQLTEITDTLASAVASAADYDTYITNCPASEENVTDVSVNIDTYASDYQPKTKVLDGTRALITEADGYVEWQFTILTAGMYQLAVDYYPIAGKTSTIERDIYLDGKLPFASAASIQFSRIWKDDLEIVGVFETDRNGNELPPQQVEEPAWVNDWYIRDLTGYYEEPFSFYLTAGTHTLRFAARSEPVAIGAITWKAPEQTLTYAEMLQAEKQDGHQPITLEEPLIIQAEAASYKSEQVLIPTNDRSSPTVVPYHVSKIRQNTVGGGGRWNSAGQWLEWNIEVPQDGLYYLSIKARQNTERGMLVCRRLYINGKTPFEEATAMSFAYSAEWGNHVLEVDGEPAYIPLKKGTNTIRLESVLGGMATYVRQVEDILTNLNACYRQIIVITSTSPDVNRDYMLKSQIPDTIKKIGEVAQRLSQLAEDLRVYCQGKNSYTAQMETFAYQLERMYERPDRIQRKLNDLSSSISSLGTCLVNMRSTALEVDSLSLCSDVQQLPQAEAGFFDKVQHEVTALVMSFIEDYSMIGGGDTVGEPVVVWLNSGRDQANALKTLIDSSDLAERGANVQLKLVQGALLQATVAGLAPDVALGLGSGDPVNYAMRKAIRDLSQFDDFEQISQRFSESALLPSKYNNGVYALPEKESWLMLFYRQDILEQLNIEVPKTWDDIYTLLPILQRNSMNFGLPITDMATGSAVGGAGVSTFGSILYQKGGQYYTDDGSASMLSSENAIDTFKQWVQFYTSYGLPASYSFANRFRSGEMPLAIADYTVFSTLVAFAPEISGLWGFTSIPGTVQMDGTVNHSAVNSVTNCVMMSQCEHPLAAWEFMKWYTESSTQVSYARILESVMGESARYPVSNLKALEQLPWTTAELQALQQQRQWVVGRPEVPGGYYTTRHIDNIFRTIYNNDADVRETVLDYVRKINGELTAKREEFGLNE